MQSALSFLDRSDPAAKNAMGWLTIDLSAIADNYTLFQKKVGKGCSVAGIVKANAYGLGVDRVAPVMEACGCNEFFVATLDEAISLRKITSHPIYMLGGLIIGAEKEYIEHSIIPVINTLDDLGRWKNLASDNGAAFETVLHFDTGMNRLGLSIDENIDDAGLNISMIMSHFACADEAENPITDDQYKKFKIIADRYPEAKKSLANSSAIFRSDDFHFDVVRPGMAVYGLNPTSEEDNPMRPVAGLRARVIQAKTVGAEEFVGYGATYRFEKESVVATVALGYADGFFRSLGNRAVLYYGDVACPVIGRVSMDLVTVDMGDIFPRQGDAMEVIGPHQSADDIASMAGTIGYEVLTSLGRYYREYIA
jgi:alanine racemase